jgi:serine/threonine-protein kinase
MGRNVEDTLPADTAGAEPTLPSPPRELARGAEAPPSPRAARDSASPGNASSLETRFGSPDDALHLDEIRRSRLLSRFGLIMAAVIAASLAFLPGDPTMTVVTWIALAVATAGNASLHHMTSRPDLYTPGRVTAVWVTAAVAVSIGVIYFGVFSAAAMVVSLGIYFLALGRSLALSLAVYLICASVQLGAAILFVAGVARDPGLIHAGYLPVWVLLIIEGLIQFITAAAFVMARASRRVTLASVAERERIVRSLVQREALLLEARLDLDRALQLGGAGRYTGQVLGSYRLGAILGRGSMGEVYEALHLESGEPAAVKLLQSSSQQNPSYVVRFLREVRVAAALEVPHVVRVLQVSEPSAPVPYLAMERLRGHDLAWMLREQRRLAADEVLDMVDQVGRGVAAAAAAGIVHRDLKPQNLFLADQPGGAPLWKILDFGVSKQLGEQGTLTHGQVVGTPIYMAPEQAQGLEVDHRADLYALAAIAYRCVTGHLPFRARDVPTILYSVVYKMPVRPGALADLHPDVDLFLLVAMAKNPASRFASAEEMAASFEDAVRGRLTDGLRAHAAALELLHPWRPAP